MSLGATPVCLLVRAQASAKYFAMNERLTARLKIADNNKVERVCVREREGGKEGGSEALGGRRRGPF